MRSGSFRNVSIASVVETDFFLTLSFLESVSLFRLLFYTLYLGILFIGYFQVTNLKYWH
jgi:hypothetical protein